MDEYVLAARGRCEETQLRVLSRNGRMRENFVIKKVGEVRQITAVSLMCVHPLSGKQAPPVFVYNFAA
jgi:hypothetical protein